jgi:hypothetical protein
MLDTGATGQTTDAGRGPPETPRVFVSAGRRPSGLDSLLCGATHAHCYGQQLGVSIQHSFHIEGDVCLALRAVYHRPYRSLGPSACGKLSSSEPVCGSFPTGVSAIGHPSGCACRRHPLSIIIPGRFSSRAGAGGGTSLWDDRASPLRGIFSAPREQHCIVGTAIRLHSVRERRRRAGTVYEGELVCEG